MNYTLAVYETAKRDLADAYNLYEKQKTGLGDDFFNTNFRNATAAYPTCLFTIK